MKTPYLIALGIMGVLLVVMAVAIGYLLSTAENNARTKHVVVHQKGTTDTQGIGIHLRDKHGSGVDLNFGHEERR